jgi:hypothetical protein
LKQIHKKRQNIRIDDNSADNIIVLIKLELSIFATNNQLCIMNDENCHDTDHNKAEDHVHELADRAPDKLKDNEPEETFDTCADKTTFLSHITFREASVSSKYHKHTECCCNSLDNRLNLVKNNDNTDQICV